MQNVVTIHMYETKTLNVVLAAFTPRVFIDSADGVVDSSSTLNRILSMMWMIPFVASMLDWMILARTPFHSNKTSVQMCINDLSNFGCLIDCLIDV